MSDTAMAIIEQIAGSNPLGIVSYEGDYSEYTPGDGAVFGCRFCLREHASLLPLSHKDDCVWLRSSRLVAPKQGGEG